MTKKWIHERVGDSLYDTEEDDEIMYMWSVKRDSIRLGVRVKGKVGVC